MLSIEPLVSSGECSKVLWFSVTTSPLPWMKIVSHHFNINMNLLFKHLLLSGYSHAFHAAQFNPVEPRLLVTANQKHGIGLWDVRRPRRMVSIDQSEVSIKAHVCFRCWSMVGWLVSRTAACMSVGMREETEYWGSGGDCHLYCTSRDLFI